MLLLLLMLFLLMMILFEGPKIDILQLNIYNQGEMEKKHFNRKSIVQKLVQKTLTRKDTHTHTQYYTKLSGQKCFSISEAKNSIIIIKFVEEIKFWKRD